MKNRVIAAMMLSVLSLGTIVWAVSEEENTTSRKAQVNALVSQLPASDAVMTLDAKRAFNDVLPRVLAGNQPMLTKILGKVDGVRSKTGIDLRQFENVAIGVSMIKTGSKSFELDLVAIARGQVNASAVMTAAKIGASGRYREERIGTRSVYVFTIDENKNKTAKPSNKFSARIADEMGATVLDANTIAVGTLPQLRKTLDGRTKLGADLAGLLGRRETAVANFAVKMPDGAGAFLPIHNDEFGKNVNAIRYLFGSFDVAGDGAALNVTAKTLQAAQAQSLLEMLQGLQALGKVALGSRTGADKQALARMVENAKFTAAGSEVTLDLRVPQSDIDVLVRKIK
ncbi:MAG: hypothetical protein LC730_04215 [Acidobacteria bacterium]|nr:hypothetical protein [Acidobacteriota bacterium]MCA1608649.1 hypothetical protein [Acidobacteriota bacterium]